MEMKNSNMFTILIPFVVVLSLSFNLAASVAPKETPLKVIGFSSRLSSKRPVLQTYIVHLKPNGKNFAQQEDRDSWYLSFLPKSVSSTNERSRLVHSYRNVITGFAARLSAEEVKEMEKKDGFLSAKVETVYSLHTTHSPNFLGLHQNLGLWKGSNYGKGIIIGLLDTGITPNHPSFSDKGVPAPPTKWKGQCENGTICNNKLIGFRNYVEDSSGGDEEGHGTHTSSTAGGNIVYGANVFGMANGTASGIAPLAHVAMYKVCGEYGCFESSILAGMDAAVEDGVDVLSLSLGGWSAPFYDDSIAIGAFTAIQKGIFVSCSAGNSGPLYSTLSNEAPWILTVGASTIDRNIRVQAYLGNKDLLDGESLNQPKDWQSDKMLPLIFPGANGDEDTAYCVPESLKNFDVKGKIVVCQRGGGIARIAKGQTVKDAGGAAMILMNQEIDGFSTLADAHVLPAIHMGYPNGASVLEYINSTTSPVGTLVFKGTVIGVDFAPEITSFSSRGPSQASPGILKPDIVGPGVSILAAWPFSVDNITSEKATYNIVSGTSMSCPHLSGIAALLKSMHPTWSPAAIKSSMMTTANLLNLDNEPIVDQNNNPADVFALGAGFVNAPFASDPGLIYDIQPEDYIPYLCGLNYTDDQIEGIVQHSVSCSSETPIAEAQLNYPSFSVALEPNQTKKYTRTVTNVGTANASFTAHVIPPEGVEISISPYKLVFTELNQKLTYEIGFVRLNATSVKNSTYVQGYLTWVNTRNFVRSPMSVMLE